MRFFLSPARTIGLLATVAALILVVAQRVEPAARALSGGTFTRASLGVAIDSPTSLTFGPDGRLYVASQTEIRAITLNDAGDGVISTEQIASNLTGVLGIAFDPTTGASPMTLYGSGQDQSAPAAKLM